MNLTLNDLTKTPKRLFIFEIVCLIILFLIHSLIWSGIYFTGLKSLDSPLGIADGNLISIVMYYSYAIANFALLVWVGQKIELFKKKSKTRSTNLFAFSCFNFIIVFFLVGGLIMCIGYWSIVYTISKPKKQINKCSMCGNTVAIAYFDQPDGTTLCNKCIKKVKK